MTSLVFPLTEARADLPPDELRVSVLEQLRLAGYEVADDVPIDVERLGPTEDDDRTPTPIVTVRVGPDVISRQKLLAKYPITIDLNFSQTGKIELLAQHHRLTKEEVVQSLVISALKSATMPW